MVQRILTRLYHKTGKRDVIPLNCLSRCFYEHYNLHLTPFVYCNYFVLHIVLRADGMSAIIKPYHTEKAERHIAKWRKENGKRYGQSTYF